jgi:ketosteroid isomerase-like protein
MYMRRWNLFAVGLLFVAPSALSAQDHMDATAAITAASEAYDAAYNVADAATISAMHTEDAIVFPAGGEPIEGMEAIAAWYEGGLVAGGPTMDLQTGEVFSVEGAALETGSWVMTGADGSHLDHGNYMVAWSHTEDGWKIARDIWNSNMAPSSGN